MDIVDMAIWTICVCLFISDFQMFPEKEWTFDFWTYLLNKHFFPKWLPRPNHYARSIRLKILCRTPVSKLWELSHASNSNLKTPNIVPWPECQPELPGDGGGGVPRILPIWQEPWSITCRDQISRSGIPHFDLDRQWYPDGPYKTTDGPCGHPESFNKSGPPGLLLTVHFKYDWITRNIADCPYHIFIWTVCTFAVPYFYQSKHRYSFQQMWHAYGMCYIYRPPELI